MKKFFLVLLILSLLLPLSGSALAQDYYFQVQQKIVHAYWEADGTLTLVYVYVFQNDVRGHIIDFVDVGLPNGNFDENTITASVDGKPVSYISRAEFQGEGGSGVAVALGGNSIMPGGTGTVTVQIPGIRGVLRPDTQGDEYASAVLVPNYFIPSVSYGQTETTVTFHLPPGVLPEEPRWHAAPSGFPSEPETGMDENGRIYYTWYAADAMPYAQYTFGASFPASYVPSSAIVRFDLGAWLEQNMEIFMALLCCGVILIPTVLSIFGARKRQMKYLPPKISIEGLGIKRGLTAVEAAILLEQPLDKVLTMILFGVLKKEAADVITQDPLKVKPRSPLPEGLKEYETAFLQAFELPSKLEQQKALSAMTVGLIKSVSEQMKGFSRKESIEYYKNIVERAWAQVQQAETPEVKSKKYDELMEWTMLDRDYEDRTRDVFRNVPVFLPTWWGHYSPTYRTASARPVTSTGGLPSTSGGGGLPSLPGSDFAASVVNGVSNLSAGVIGSVSQFTSAVTAKTNPVPVSTTTTTRSGGTRSGGSSGRSCACACACAGCACACAGGGR